MTLDNAPRPAQRTAAPVDVPFPDASLVLMTAAYQPGDRIFTQGDACDDVLYLHTGRVKLSVVSADGRDAVVALLGPGEFFGEACLTGQSLRKNSATALTSSAVVTIHKEEMTRSLRDRQPMSSRFISHMLTRQIRVEEDLVAQLFHTSEWRLARLLLMLARPGPTPQVATVTPKVTQETLAAMVGTTRARVNLFLNKFRKLGYISYNRTQPLTVNSSQLREFLDDDPRR